LFAAHWLTGLLLLSPANVLSNVHCPVATQALVWLCERLCRVSIKLLLTLAIHYALLVFLVVFFLDDADALRKAASVGAPCWPFFRIFLPEARLARMLSQRPLVIMRLV
jgi:hypothetical protein